ncbi:hypothetical protein FCI23_34475 [Actinacidiphila oryziradicis]|uniref:Hydantoinase/oxoprolinase N-terminal domain-containing protein n=1 Tax=Actinacidiphila oryziradicis TaxID=2571141 RepID=A0A4U0S949_9ACTN|nr:hypothetical protein FCI23_34475 [Actinacidiphila oryziradicis]
MPLRVFLRGESNRAVRPWSRAHGVEWGQVDQITVGSTLALNAVSEGRGAPTALVTTRGFGDVLDIARERRSALYDLQQVVAAPLIPRQLRYEVDERVAADGEIVSPLDLDRAAGPLLAWLDASGVESVAISLVNSYAWSGTRSSSET